MKLAAKIDDHISLYTALVYSISRKRKINLVNGQHIAKNGKVSYALFFSTNLPLSAETIYRYHTSRFQIQFIFRDARQFTGLTHCQACSKESLHLHFNVRLALLNPMRTAHRLRQSDRRESFSMASYKRQYANEMMLNLFLSKLEPDPNWQKIQTVYQERHNYGAIAA